VGVCGGGMGEGGRMGGVGVVEGGGCGRASLPWVACTINIFRKLSR
jgi:hypothetical protein